MNEDRPYFRPLSIQNRQSGETLSIKPFRGNIHITVFTKSGGKPPFSASMDDFTYNMFRKLIKKVRESAPDTKIPIKAERFDPNTKQFVLDWVITLQKDSKMCYHLILTNCRNNMSFDFLLKGKSGVSIGADPMSEAGKSGVQLDVVEQWLDRTYAMLPWCDEKFDPNNRGGNGGGNAGGGSSAPQQPAPASSEGDIPW